MKKLTKKNKITFKKLLIIFWEFFKIGLFTIGGGMAMIPQIRELCVKEKKWLSEQEMIDALAISQSLPGAIAINCATYIGYRINRYRGSIVATIGVIAPSFIIILLVVILLGQIGDNQYIEGALIGIKAAVAALILVAVIDVAKDAIKGIVKWIICILTFITIVVFEINAIWVIILGAILGIIINTILLSKKGDKKNDIS